MTLDEAIDLLERCRGNLPQVGYEWVREAHQLGIEALERVKHVRETYQKTSYVLLPGETEE